MKIPNQWADGDDLIREDQQYRMKEEGGPSNWRDDHRSKRQRFDGRDAVELIAAGFNNPREDNSRDDNRQYSQGQYSRGQDSYRQGGQKREWKPRRVLTPEEELDMPCRHHMFRNPETGKWGANHLLKDCRKAQKIYDALSKKLQAPAPTQQPGPPLAIRGPPTAVAVAAPRNSMQQRLMRNINHDRKMQESQKTSTRLCGDSST